MSDFLFQFYALLCEMAPYLLLGFLIAGILHAFVSPVIYSRYLSGNDFKSILLAALAGVPLPLCSCGVIPTATSMKFNGASRASTVAFLITTPQTGVDSIAATYALMGLPFAIVRPIAAFLTGIFGGIITGRVTGPEKATQKNTTTEACETQPAQQQGFFHKTFEALRYGFFDMVQDIGKNLIIGLIIGAAIAIFVPADFFSLYATHPLLNMFIVLVLAVPMYVCATGSIPIAAALMFKGLTPGAALVFLMAGPAINMASVMVVGKVIGRKAMACYIGSIVAGAILFGLLIDYALPADWFIIPREEAAHMCHVDTAIPLWQQIGSWVLIAMLAVALGARYLLPHKHSKHQENMDLQFKVEGMNCNHCKNNVEKAIMSVPGVESVTVDLSSGTATVSGTPDAEEIVKRVNENGYVCSLKS